MLAFYGTFVQYVNDIFSFNKISNVGIVSLKKKFLGKEQNEALITLSDTFSITFSGDAWHSKYLSRITKALLFWDHKRPKKAGEPLKKNSDV